MAVNEAIPFYEAGQDITGHCDAAVTGKRFVKINATKQAASAGVTDSVLGGNVKIVHATAAGRIFGVASHDCPSGGKVTVKRGSGLVIPVTASGALTAFQEVEVAANGKATVLASGKAVGYVLADCADGADAMVNLY